LGDGPTPKPNFFIEYSVVNTEPNNGKNSIVCGMVHGTWGCKRCLVASPVITTRAHNNPVLFVIPTVQISNFKINLKGEKVYQQFHLQQLRTLSTLLTSSILPFVWSEKPSFTKTIVIGGENQMSQISNEICLWRQVQHRM
jgi:hypothetical protein